MLDVCPPDPVRAVLVELRRVDAADVVRLEDLRVEHEAHRSLAPSRDGGLTPFRSLLPQT